jgi:hypothetical protein
MQHSENSFRKENNLRKTYNFDTVRAGLKHFLSLNTSAIDAPSLTLRASPAQGMHIHLGKAKRDQNKLNAAPEFVTIAESASTQCYFYKVNIFCIRP